MKPGNKFIDFDKKSEIFYDNLYINGDVVIKIPLNSNNGKTIKLDKFNLSKYTYLITYD
jgi:hypothetical protein